MKKSILLLFLFTPLISFCQTFSSPESVEYDSVNTRWLVSQTGSHTVLVYDPSSGNLSPFCSGMSSGPYGIEILGNVLFCCDGGSIKGFDLTTGSQVFNVALAGATFLNGITSDGVNNLFTTDFSGKKIYRVNVSAATSNRMVTTVKTPNGIIYDGAHNRCVFVTWGANAAFQAMSLADSAITTLKTTSLSSFDGIMRDHQGNWYSSSWGNSSLNKFDSGFVSGPAIVMSGLTSPADLGINSAGDSIGIPNSGTANNVVFYHISLATGIEKNNEQRHNVLFPNPSDDRTTIMIEKPVINGTIELSDMSGRIIKKQEISGYIFFLERDMLPSGSYTVTVRESNGAIVHSQKMIYR